MAPLLAGSSEPSRARALDLMLLGRLLASRLADDGTLPRNSGFVRLWSRHIVPRAVDRDCPWQFGMTAAVTGLTTPAGKPFNGRVGRISGHTSDARWELLIEGPQGLGSVNIRSANLEAARSVADVLTAWHRISNRSQALPDAEPPLARLHAAVATGDQLKAEALLHAGGVGLSDADESGRTALHVALERLISLDEEAAAAAEDEDDEDAEGEEGERGGCAADTPLSDARVQLLAVVDWLLLHAPCQASSDSGAQPLRAVDVNARDKNERTPLHMAARAGLGEVARSLLLAGADPAVRSKQRSTLHEATIRGDAALVRLLLSYAVKAASGCGAAGVGRGDSLEHRDYVSGVGRDGWTALGLASRAGHVACLEALLESGADPTVMLGNGKAALEIARLNRNTTIVALLEGSGQGMGRKKDD